MTDALMTQGLVASNFVEPCRFPPPETPLVLLRIPKSMPTKVKINIIISFQLVRLVR
jgi:hypothetical protein